MYFFFLLLCFTLFLWLIFSLGIKSSVNYLHFLWPPFSLWNRYSLKIIFIICLFWLFILGTYLQIRLFNLLISFLLILNIFRNLLVLCTLSLLYRFKSCKLKESHRQILKPSFFLLNKDLDKTLHEVDDLGIVSKYYITGFYELGFFDIFKAFDIT